MIQLRTRFFSESVRLECRSIWSCASKARFHFPFSEGGGQSLVRAFSVFQNRLEQGHCSARGDQFYRTAPYGHVLCVHYVKCSTGEEVFVAFLTSTTIRSFGT